MDKGRNKKSQKESKLEQGSNSLKKIEKGSNVFRSEIFRGSELTEREIRLGRATWSKNIDHQQSVFGVLIFRELFLRYPEYEYFFLHMLKGSTATDIFASQTFKSHMTDRIVPKLKEILDNLENPEELNEIMTKLGLYHAKLNIKRRQFEDMLKVLIASISKIMGNKLQPDEEDALEKCFGRAFGIAIDVMENYYRLNPDPDEQVVKSSSASKPRG